MITTLALMCALAAAECPSANAPNDAARIADAIDDTVDDDRLRAVLVVYTYRESHWQIDPAPHSHDAHDRTSCGMLQMRCGFVATHTLEQQVRVWLRYVQSSSLPSVDSLTSRALVRLRKAEAILEECRNSETPSTTPLAASP